MILALLGMLFATHLRLGVRAEGRDMQISMTIDRCPEHEALMVSGEGVSGEMRSTSRQISAGQRQYLAEWVRCSSGEWQLVAILVDRDGHRAAQVTAGVFLP